VGRDHVFAGLSVGLLTNFLIHKKKREDAAEGGVWPPRGIRDRKTKKNDDLKREIDTPLCGKRRQDPWWILRVQSLGKLTKRESKRQ